MDIDEELNDLIGNYSDKVLSQKVSSIFSIKNGNECETRREQKAVNQSILKNTMHEWTTVVDDQIIGNTKEIKKIDVSKPGEQRNAWQTHKDCLLKDDSMGGDIMRILYADIKKNSTKVNPEDKYIDGISRLQQERSNRMHHEQMMSKRRMSHKIKSKNFHRHVKRRDMKEFLKKEEDKSKAGNADQLKEKLMEFEKLRAQERISLKHKLGGKFAKIQRLRAKYDPNARDALTNMREKGQELTVKMNDNVDSDEENVSELSGEEEDPEEEGSQDEEMVAANGEELRNSKRHKAKAFVEKNKSGSKGATGEKVSSTISTSQSNFLNYDETMMEESGEVVYTDEARFKDAIYEIYQQDSELAAKFEKEKLELVEKENPKDLQLFKAGWGPWTGPGFEASDKRRKRRGLIKAPDTRRNDKKKTRVWIKQGMHEGLKKHLIKTIPYPYNTAEQFNLSRKELVSGVFNLQTVHRDLIKPRFINKAGQHIYPRQKLEKAAFQ